MIPRPMILVLSALALGAAYVVMIALFVLKICPITGLSPDLYPLGVSADRLEEWSNALTDTALTPYVWALSLWDPVFILGATVFIIALGWQGPRQIVSWIIVACALIYAATDWSENQAIMQHLVHLQNEAVPSPMADQIASLTMWKFILLAMGVFLAYGSYRIRKAGNMS